MKKNKKIWPKQQKESLNNKIENIARKWKEDDISAISNLPFDHPRFDEALLEEADLSFLGDLSKSFYEEIRSMVMQMSMTVVIPNPKIPSQTKECLGDIQMFLIPVFGIKTNIGKYLDDSESYEYLVKSFRKSNISHSQSNIVLATFTVGASELIKTGPKKIKQITTYFKKAMEAAALNKNPRYGTFESYIEQARVLINGETFKETKEKISFKDKELLTTRYILGMRFAIQDIENENIEEEMDYFSGFMPPEILASLEELSEEEEKLAHTAISTWQESNLEKSGKFSVLISRPMDWDEALCEWTKNNITICFNVGREKFGIRQDRAADALNIYKDEEKNQVYLWLDYDGLVVGPVKVTTSIINISLEELIDETVQESTFSKIIYHESIENLPEPSMEAAVRN